MPVLVPVGRLLFSFIFIYGGFGHFTKAEINYAAGAGVPMAHVAVPLSGAIAILGGLMILLGLYAQFGAALIILFLIPVTFTMHRFWGLSDAQMAQMQQIHFMKNMCMLGGVMLIAYFGAGPFSFDEIRSRKSPSPDIGTSATPSPTPPRS